MENINNIFYELNKKISSVKKAKFDEFRLGSNILFVDEWKENYKINQKLMSEEFFEILIGTIENLIPLKFSIAFYLNTKQNIVAFSEGNSNIPDKTIENIEKNEIYILKNDLLLRNLINKFNPYEWPNYRSFSNNKIYEVLEEINSYLQKNEYKSNLDLQNISKNQLIEEKDINITSINADLKLIETLETLKSEFKSSTAESKGFYLIYNIWNIPYKDEYELITEEFYEIIIGPIKKSNPLTFEEAILLNTYHHNLVYHSENLVIEQFNLLYKNKLIKIDKNFYENLKINLDITNWSRNIVYKSEIINKFKESILKELENIKKLENMSKKDEIIIDERNLYKDFETGDFYQPLINILLNQNNSNPNELEIGKDCIYFNTWREKYKHENKLTFEIFLELFVGRIKQIQPLTITNGFYFNTYNGILQHIKNDFIINSKISSSEIISIKHELLERLKLVLNPNNWDKSSTYNKKHITPFVRILENYFLGKYEGKNYRIIKKNILYKSENCYGSIINIEVEAKDIAKMALPGQFIVLRLHERGERFPLTIVDSDSNKGTIRLIYQVIGKSTYELFSLEEGDYILDLLGPLGKPIEVIKHEKPVICIAGGVGAASIYSKVKALKMIGNYVILILGAKSKEQLILVNELRQYCNELYLTTDDGLLEKDFDGNECIYRLRNNGSKLYGGFVNYILEALIGQDFLLRNDNKKIPLDEERFISYGPKNLVNRYKQNDISEIIAVGPVPMMWSIVKTLTQKNDYNPSIDYNKQLPKLLVSLNPIMIDGTGMCGGCRVGIYNPTKNIIEKKFTCVDGPIFDGFLVDFQTLMKRLMQYRLEEQQALKFLEILGW